MLWSLATMLLVRDGAGTSKRKGDWLFCRDSVYSPLNVPKGACVGAQAEVLEKHS